jgi:hypothetical protein
VGQFPWIVEFLLVHGDVIFVDLYIYKKDNSEISIFVEDVYSWERGTHEN